MQDSIKLLAQQCGFCFYTAEEDLAEPIDWSCDYEQEFKDFAIALQKQTRDETINEVVNLLMELHAIANNRHNYYLVVANLIKEDFI
jgi:hypothetical protein